MQIQTTQVRVTLPQQLQSYVQSKAQKYGLTMSAYIKNLIIDDAKNLEAIPTFQMSEETEKKGLKALEEHRLGKTHEMNDVDDFFDSI